MSFPNVINEILLFSFLWNFNLSCIESAQLGLGGLGGEANNEENIEKETHLWLFQSRALSAS